jgi:hypothetical protein
MAPKRSGRRMRRFPVSCAIVYVMMGQAGRGQAADVSLRGLRVKGASAVEPGTLLSVTLFLADNNEPIHITARSCNGHAAINLGCDFPLCRRRYNSGS